MNKKELDSLSCEDLVSYVHHELNQKSSTALSCLQVLLDENNYGFVSDNQQQVLTLLHEEVKVIRIITEEIGMWYSIHKNTE